MKSVAIAAISGISLSIFAQEISLSTGNRIVEGGPDAGLARTALESRMISDGKIQLLHFIPTATILTNSLAAFGFEADALFPETGYWKGTNLTFPSDTGIFVTNQERYTFWGQALFIWRSNAWQFKEIRIRDKPRHTEVVQEERCFNHMRLLSCVFAQYELVHDGKDPYMLSTNEDGSKEYCGRNAEGQDTNSFSQYRTLAPFLYQPDCLVCPADSSKTAAPNFKDFSAENVSYLIYSTRQTARAIRPHLPLATCPIHHFTLYRDGDISKNGHTYSTDTRD
jgi:hypothetical protein